MELSCLHQIADMMIAQKQKGFWDKYSGFVYGIVTVIVVIIIFRLMTKYLHHHAKKHGFTEEHAITFIRYWQYAYIFIAMIIIIVAFSGEIQALGLTMGFISSILAWMLSAPVRNMAGWLFLIATKPFKVGDRIIIGGYTGDVTDITINHIILDQVGGTTVGEDKSGRGVLIPTSWLFDQLINNYSMKLPSDETDNKYLLDEVVVRITYDSDWEVAEKILIDVAKEVTHDVIEETKEEPYVRAEFFPSGVFMRLRYRVPPKDRQRVWTEIVKGITQKINETDKVSYSLNRGHVYVRYPKDGPYPPQYLPLLMRFREGKDERN